MRELKKLLTKKRPSIDERFSDLPSFGGVGGGFMDGGRNCL
jgi:hypothetical protein